jgi:hypothetical protein
VGGCVWRGVCLKRGVWRGSVCVWRGVWRVVWRECVHGGRCSEGLRDGRQGAKDEDRGLGGAVAWRRGKGGVVLGEEACAGGGEGCSE